MNILVIGRRGEGKSTLAEFIAERIQDRAGAHTIAIFDPKRTYTGIPHTSDFDEFEELLVSGDLISVAFQPVAPKESEADDEVSEQFDEFISVLGIDYHLGVREAPARKNLHPVVLVIDEAWFLQSGARANGKLEEIVRLADSENFYLIQAAHRPKDFSTKIRAQVDEIYIFRQWLPEDVDIIREWCGDEVAERVQTLPKHHVIRFEISTRNMQVWSHPEGWYRKIKLEGNEHDERLVGGGGSEGGGDNPGENEAGIAADAGATRFDN